MFIAVLLNTQDVETASVLPDGVRGKETAGFMEQWDSVQPFERAESHRVWPVDGL